MIVGDLPPLASIAAVRPVFLIIMGISLVVIAWRLASQSGRWTSRLLMAGALMLGFGYAILLPLYEAGVIAFYSPRNPHVLATADTVAWHVVKATVMNAGWLLFGIGVALHANLFGLVSPGSHPQPSPHPRSRHDLAA